MYFYGYIQADALINFFIPLRRAEAITWEIFSRQKEIPALRNRDPTLNGWNFTCKRKI